MSHQMFSNAIEHLDRNTMALCITFTIPNFLVTCQMALCGGTDNPSNLPASYSLLYLLKLR